MLSLLGEPLKKDILQLMQSWKQQRIQTSVARMLIEFPLMNQVIDAHAVHTARLPRLRASDSEDEYVILDKA